MRLRAVYALALRLHVLPDQVFEMTETDFVYLLAAAKLDAEDQERRWRQQK